MKSLAGDFENGPTVAEEVLGGINSPRSVCAPLAICMHDGSVEQVALCEPSASVRKSVGRFVTLRGPAREAGAKYFCDAWAATVEDKQPSGPSATGYVRLVVFDGRICQRFEGQEPDLLLCKLLYFLAYLRRKVLTDNGNFADLVSGEFGLDEQWVPSELVELCDDESMSSKKVARLLPSETGLHSSSPSKGMSSQWWRDAGVPLRFGVGDRVKYFCDQQQCFIPGRVTELWVKEPDIAHYLHAYKVQPEKPEKKIRKVSDPIFLSIDHDSSVQSGAAGTSSRPTLMLAELNCVDERVKQLLSNKLPDTRSVTEALYLALIDGLSSMKPAASAEVCAPGSAAAHDGGASSPPSVSSTNRLEQVTRHALKRGAEVNSRWTLPHVGADKEVVHFPLLAFAVFSRNVWACRLLCEYGADVNATLVDKRPPRARNSKYAASLAHEGRHGTWDGWTPLMLAVHLNLKEVCKLLVIYGADVKVEAGDRCFNEELDTNTKLKQGLSNKELAKALSRSPKTVVKPASAKALAATQAILEIVAIADSLQSWFESVVFKKAELPEKPRPMGEMLSLDTKAVPHSPCGCTLEDKLRREMVVVIRSKLEAIRAKLGDRHSVTLNCIDDLGEQLYLLGNLDDAEPLFREALETRRATLGDRHHDTLTSIGNLGDLLLAQGKFDEVEPLLREELEATCATLGDRHPDTLELMKHRRRLLVRQHARAGAFRPAFAPWAVALSQGAALPEGAHVYAVGETDTITENETEAAAVAAAATAAAAAAVAAADAAAKALLAEEDDAAEKNKVKQAKKADKAQKKRKDEEEKAAKLYEERRRAKAEQERKDENMAPTNRLKERGQQQKLSDACAANTTVPEMVPHSRDQLLVTQLPRSPRRSPTPPCSPPSSRASRPMLAQEKTLMEDEEAADEAILQRAIAESRAEAEAQEEKESSEAEASADAHARKEKEEELQATKQMMKQTREAEALVTKKATTPPRMTLPMLALRGESCDGGGGGGGSGWVSGLANEVGRNACFINVIVHCLHDCEPLRSLVAGATHAPSAAPIHVTLLRELQAAFAALSAAERGASAFGLQAAVEALDEGSGGGFKLGERHDATEVLEHVLAAVDLAIVGNGVQMGADGSSVLKQRNGPVATLLSMGMRLERKPEDGGPLWYTQWTQYIVGCRLRDKVRELSEQVQLRKKGFEQEALVALLAAARDEDSQPIRMERAPKVLTLALSADSADPSKDEVAATLAGVPASLNLTDAFEELGGAAPYELRALITLYGEHWVCYRWNIECRQWWKYDDSSIVMPVSARLEDVKTRCVAGRELPITLFYHRIGD